MGFVGLSRYSWLCIITVLFWMFMRYSGVPRHPGWKGCQIRPNTRSAKHQHSRSLVSTVQWRAVEGGGGFLSLYKTVPGISARLCMCVCMQNRWWWNTSYSVPLILTLHLAADPELHQRPSILYVPCSSLSWPHFFLTGSASLTARYIVMEEWSCLEALVRGKQDTEGIKRQGECWLAEVSKEGRVQRCANRAFLSTEVTREGV